MFEWLSGRKRRDQEFLMGLMKAAAEGDRLHRLRQAIATISVEPLHGKDATELAVDAATTLTRAMVKEANGAIVDDDDRFVSGLFAFVFSDYFATLLAGSFEMAAPLAVLGVLGSDEFDRCFNTIQVSYNEMVRSKRTVIEAIGKTCEAWFKQPTPEKFARLVELYAIFRNRTVKS